MKNVTAKQARAIWRKAGAIEIKVPKLTLTQAEKMGLEYWNEALEIAACIAEGYEFSGMRGREIAVVPAVKELIAKAIRKQKAKR